MLKQFVLMVVLLAGCEGSEKAKTTSASPQTSGAPAAASEDTVKWAAAHATVESLQNKAGADSARLRGLEISEECKQNPLANGCT